MISGQPRCRSHGHEKLATVRVWSGIRHRQLSRLIELVGRPFGLVFELVSGATHPSAARVATLDHEVGDYSMEHCAVIQRPRAGLTAHVVIPVTLSLGKVSEVLNRLGS